MLVKLRRRMSGHTEEGSALIAVLVIMLVLSVGGMALAAIVTNTSGILSDARSTTQSRAVADAGLADALGLAKRSGSFCGLTLEDDLPSGNGVTPEYSVTTTCDTTAKTVTFTSIGRAGSGETTTRAVYNYTSGSTGHGADMVFYSDTTFTKEVLTSTASNGLLSIVIPSGGFECMVHTPANVIASGDLVTKSGCVIDGNARVGGKVTMNGAADTIKGSLTASSTASAKLEGQILGDITLGGGLTTGWNNRTYPGKVSVRGNVNLASNSIAGTVTIPKANYVEYDGYLKINSPTATSPRVAGGLVWQDTVPIPTAPTFDPWFDYTYNVADWRPFNGVTFTEITLVNSGNGPWTCNRFKDNNPQTSGAAGWRELGALTTPTIINATACGTLTSNNGSVPNVALGTDIVFIAKSFDLTQLTFTAKSGASPRLWYIVNDGAPTGAGAGVPSCTNGAGNIVSNHTDMAGVTAMLYTPCTIKIEGNSKWTGAFYGGAFSYGGGMTFVGANIALPGMPASATLPGAGTSSSSALGTLVSRGDLP
ncbi:UNVERIFIED_CONTAM: hypothetical protein OHV15_03655 [Microbacterium sp. SLM126]